MTMDLHMCVGSFLLRPTCEEHAQLGGTERPFFAGALFTSFFDPKTQEKGTFDRIKFSAGDESIEWWLP